MRKLLQAHLFDAKYTQIWYSVFKAYLSIANILCIAKFLKCNFKSSNVFSNYLLFVQRVPSEQELIHLFNEKFFSAKYL